MDNFRGYHYSFQGFIDYNNCYHTIDISWMIIGGIIFLGTIISVIPQLTIIISNRSSYGLNSFSIGFTSFGQFIMIVNLISLHCNDFVGLLQIPINISFPRMMTFINVFTLWFMYFFIPILTNIFFDIESRRNRTLPEIPKERKLNIKIFIILILLISILSLLPFIIGYFYSYGGNFIYQLGKYLGTLASILVFAQYLPQMITTCKLKDTGSLSLMMLSIQGPGGLINTLFMWIGNHDHWTTWLSFMIASLQQLLLLFIGIYFKLTKKPTTFSSSPLLTQHAEIFKN